MSIGLVFFFFLNGFGREIKGKRPLDNGVKGLG